MRVIMTGEEVRADPARWLAERRADKQGRPRISASEIASIFRVEGSYEQPIQVYWRKVMGTDAGGTRLMAYGTWLEGWAARCYAEAEPSAVLEDGPLVCHGKRQWQIASLDLVEHNPALPGIRVIEVKTVRGWAGWGDPPHGEIPPRFQAQGIWQGDVTGAEEVRVIAIDRDSGQPKIYWIDMDTAARKDAALMREAAEEFRARIMDRRPPPVTYSAGTLEILRAVYRPVIEEAIVIPGRLGQRLVSAKRRLDAAKASYGQAEAEVRERLRTGTRAIGRDGTVYATRTVFTPRRVPVGELRENYPEVAAELTVDGKTVDKLTVRGTAADGGE